VEVSAVIKNISPLWIIHTPIIATVENKAPSFTAVVIGGEAASHRHASLPRRRSDELYVHHDDLSGRRLWSDDPGPRSGLPRHVDYCIHATDGESKVSRPPTSAHDTQVISVGDTTSEIFMPPIWRDN
jgi:hypothetical protein